MPHRRGAATGPGRLGLRLPHRARPRHGGAPAGADV